jgi:hypothetical protein
MKNTEIINKFLNVILNSEEKLVFGPSDLTQGTDIHFNTAKNFIDEFSLFSNAIEKLRNEGVKLIGGETPKGTPRLMIVPTEETIEEINEIEMEIGIHPRPLRPPEKQVYNVEKINKELIRRTLSPEDINRFPPRSRPEIPRESVVFFSQERYSGYQMDRGLINNVGD